MADGQSLLKKVLDGDTKMQIEAIWQYLADGSNPAEPSGLGRDPIPLVPQKEPIVYRNFIAGPGPGPSAWATCGESQLAFDANEMRLAPIWQGAFIDAARHWSGRGEGYQPRSGTTS